ncbi:MAG TPA: bifunctional DNA primase/polymerase [Gemmataceae bacterium]|nr:bifunctional DNA primase/polymerase [Gemmataceae bacterium]
MKKAAPHSSEQTKSVRDAALRYAELGYVCIPVMPGKKSPPLLKWKRYQSEAPAPETYRDWFADNSRNIAILTGETVVADVDDPSLFEFVMEKCGTTKVVSKTPSGGFHFWYRRRRGVHVGNRVNVRGHDFDLRAEGGYAIVPPSRTKAGKYEWLGAGLGAISELPLFKVSWTNKRTSRPVVKFGQQSGPSKSNITNPEAYCLRIPSVQGQHGSCGLVRVVCILRDAGRSPEEVFEFMYQVWNPRCARPEWSEQEIRRAILRHFRWH